MKLLKNSDINIRLAYQSLLFVLFIFNMFFE